MAEWPREVAHQKVCMSDNHAKLFGEQLLCKNVQLQKKPFMHFIIVPSITILKLQYQQTESYRWYISQVINFVVV